MHRTALENGRRFFACYGEAIGRVTVLDIGIAGGAVLRSACPAKATYLGVDLAPGRDVDVVLDDPYKFPFDDNSIGVVISSSCFEHSDMFWLLYLEIMRVLAPAGLLYLNAPSNGNYHRYPVDCWRFYPDSGRALVHWGQRNGLNSAVLESYTSNQHLRETWNDFVCVFIKDQNYANKYPHRMIDSFNDFSNGFRGTPEGTETVLNSNARPQDQRYYGWRLHKRLQRLRWYLRTGFGIWDRRLY